MSVSPSSDNEPYESGITGKGCELPSSPDPRLTHGTNSDSDISGSGLLKDGAGGGQGSSSCDGSTGQTAVMVAQPPRGSGKEAGLQEIALTGSEALDVLDQVSQKLGQLSKKIRTELKCWERY